MRVVSAQHQAEAELVQGILLEEGIPSMTRRSAGFDVPDMLAAGRRDILVPASGLSAARDVLMQADLLPAQAGPAVERRRACSVSCWRGGPRRPRRLDRDGAGAVTIAVTGATGALGSRVAARLAARKAKQLLVVRDLARVPAIAGVEAVRDGARAATATRRR